MQPPVKEFFGFVRSVVSKYLKCSECEWIQKIAVRFGWTGYKKPKKVVYEMHELSIKPYGSMPRWVVIHHSATQDSGTKNWEAIRRYHVEFHGWSDIGYNLGVENVNGKLLILDGRMIGETGAHALGFNKQSVGICLIGNYDLEPPSEDRLDLLARLVRQIQKRFSIPRHQVIGHRETYGIRNVEVEKSCPGSRFDLNHFRNRLIDIKKSLTKIYLVAVPLAVLIPICGETATRDDLRAQIQNLERAVSSMGAAVDINAKQATDVISAISAVTAPPLSLTVAMAEGKKMMVVDIPINLKNGTPAVCSVQFDVDPGSGLRVTGVTPGIAALAANKSVAGNPVSDGFRVIVFGINQTIIPNGPVAILKVAIDASAAVGKIPVVILNTLGVDPPANSVAVSGRSGWVNVRE